MIPDPRNHACLLQCILIAAIPTDHVFQLLKVSRFMFQDSQHACAILDFWLFSIQEGHFSGASWWS